MRSIGVYRSCFSFFLLVAGASVVNAEQSILPEYPANTDVHAAREYVRKADLSQRPAGPEVVKFEVSPFKTVLFPRNVDLSDQFSTIPSQRGGMCHVYAGVDLVEAACYRYLGKRVQISRPYLIYRHLRSKFAGLSSYDLDKKKLAPHHFFIPECDGGFCEHTIGRIFNNSACTAGEFRAEEELLDYLSSAAETARREMKEKTAGKRAYARAIEEKCKAQFPKSVCARMDEIAKAGLGDLATETNLGISARSADKALQDCLKLNLHGDILPYSKTEAMKLLKEGIPFLCSSRYDFNDSYGKVGHVGVVTGYSIVKTATKLEDSQVLWLERHATPEHRGNHWFRGDCQTIIVLYARH